MEIIAGLVLAVLAVHVLLAGILVLQVRLLSRPRVEAVSEAGGGRVPPAEEERWATENGFAFLGNYVMKIGGQLARIAVWQRPDRPTFFCRYVIEAQNRRQQSYDLVTLFAEEVGLTTGSSRDGQLFPTRPGSFMQTFTGLSLDQQWSVHIDMENYLMDRGGAGLVELEEPFEAVFVRAIVRQMEYIKTIPFWPLRGAYWYFVRRYQRHGKTIQQQHDKGWKKLPNGL